jgi:exopolyphosphatase/guanosine-5'-triphosphate,3'-diphosphate pyrophosphatase
MKLIFVDVGGGVQSSPFSNSKIVTSRSFKRNRPFVNEMVCDVVWDEIEKWIKTNTAIMKSYPDWF